MLGTVEQFIAQAQELYASDPEEMTPYAMVAVAGQIVAGTPWVDLP